MEYKQNFLKLIVYDCFYKNLSSQEAISLPTLTFIIPHKNIHQNFLSMILSSNLNIELLVLRAEREIDKG